MLRPRTGTLWMERSISNLKTRSQVDIPVNSDRTVDLDNAPFLSAIRQQFDITGLSRPYDLNNDSKLLRTFELDFSQFDKIEEIIEELAKNPDFEYVEKVPLDHIDFTHRMIRCITILLVIITGTGILM